MRVWLILRADMQNYRQYSEPSFEQHHSDSGYWKVKIWKRAHELYEILLVGLGSLYYKVRGH